MARVLALACVPRDRVSLASGQYSQKAFNTLAGADMMLGLLIIIK